MSVNIYVDSKIANAQFLMDEWKEYFERIYSSTLNQVEVASDADIRFELVHTQTDIDQIKIDIQNGKGLIQSNTPIGLLIALYRFFKQVGVRYLRPGKENEVIPMNQAVQFQDVVVQIEETASFKHRGVCIEGADSFENVQNFIDWLPKIGMNSFFIQFENPYSFLKRWYEHECNPYLEKEPFSNEIAQDLSNRIDEELIRRGLVHHRVGHGWTGEVLGYSSKYGWDANEALPEDKKALAAEVNGKRELFGSAPILTSLDFANPEVSKKMVEVIVDYAKKRLDVDYLHVWLSDARNNICECSNCQKEILSDQYIRMLNQLDEAMTEEGIDTKICFLLYHELLFAPEKEKLNNPARFTMMFAPITRTFEKSYADIDYNQGIPTMPEYIRNKMSLPNSLEENLSYLFEWKKNFSGDSFVYDYPLGRAHYGDLGYMNISEIIYRDVKYLDRLQLNGYISCQELRAGFPHNFPNYVMGHMLWNNTLTYEDLVAEYFSNVYGTQWREAVAYLSNLSKYSSCDYFNAIGERINPMLSNRYAIAVNLAKGSLAMIAENTSRTTNLQKKQWLQLGYHREYVIKLASALQSLSEGNNELAYNQWQDFLDYIRRNEEKTQSHLDVYRVIQISKYNAGFDRLR